MTTEQLIACAEAALPDYSGQYTCEPDPAFEAGQGCDCSAFRDLSDNETSVSIRRFKYKFQFPDPGVDGYLKILWNETFKPTLSAPVTYCGTDYDVGDEDPDPTHWTITPMSEVFGDGDTESSIHEVLEPSTNGTVYPTDIRWTKTPPPEMGDPCEPAASSIEGVDQFADSTSTTYLCNDRDPADANCYICP